MTRKIKNPLDEDRKTSSVNEQNLNESEEENETLDVDLNDILENDGIQVQQETETIDEDTDIILSVNSNDKPSNEEIDNSQTFSQMIPRLIEHLQEIYNERNTMRNDRALVGVRPLTNGEENFMMKQATEITINMKMKLNPKLKGFEDFYKELNRQLKLCKTYQYGTTKNLKMSKIKLIFEDLLAKDDAEETEELNKSEADAFKSLISNVLERSEDAVLQQTITVYMAQCSPDNDKNKPPVAPNQNQSDQSEQSSQTDQASQPQPTVESDSTGNMSTTTTAPTSTSTSTTSIQSSEPTSEAADSVITSTETASETLTATASTSGTRSTTVTPKRESKIPSAKKTTPRSSAQGYTRRTANRGNTSNEGQPSTTGNPTPSTSSGYYVQRECRIPSSTDVVGNRGPTRRDAERLRKNNNSSPTQQTQQTQKPISKQQTKKTLDKTKTTPVSTTQTTTPITATPETTSQPTTSITATPESNSLPTTSLTTPETTLQPTTSITTLQETTSQPSTSITTTTTTNPPSPNSILRQMLQTAVRVFVQGDVSMGTDQPESSGASSTTETSILRQILSAPTLNSLSQNVQSDSAKTTLKRTNTLNIECSSATKASKSEASNQETREEERSEDSEMTPVESTEPVQVNEVNESHTEETNADEPNNNEDSEVCHENDERSATEESSGADDKETVTTSGTELSTSTSSKEHDDFQEARDLSQGEESLPSPQLPLEPTTELPTASAIETSDNEREDRFDDETLAEVQVEDEPLDLTTPYMDERVIVDRSSDVLLVSGTRTASALSKRKVQDVCPIPRKLPKDEDVESSMGPLKSPDIPKLEFIKIVEDAVRSSSEEAVDDLTASSGSRIRPPVFREDVQRDEEDFEDLDVMPMLEDTRNLGERAIQTPPARNPDSEEESRQETRTETDTDSDWEGPEQREGDGQQPVPNIEEEITREGNSTSLVPVYNQNPYVNYLRALTNFVTQPSRGHFTPNRIRYQFLDQEGSLLRWALQMPLHHTVRQINTASASPILEAALTTPGRPGSILIVASLSTGQLLSRYLLEQPRSRFRAHGSPYSSSRRPTIQMVFDSVRSEYVILPVNGMVYRTRNIRRADRLRGRSPLASGSQNVEARRANVDESSSHPPEASDPKPGLRGGSEKIQAIKDFLNTYKRMGLKGGSGNQRKGGRRGRKSNPPNRNPTNRNPPNRPNEDEETSSDMTVASSSEQSARNISDESPSEYTGNPNSYRRRRNRMRSTLETFPQQMHQRLREQLSEPSSFSSPSESPPIPDSSMDQRVVQPGPSGLSPRKNPMSPKKSPRKEQRTPKQSPKSASSSPVSASLGTRTAPYTVPACGRVPRPRFTSPEVSEDIEGPPEPQFSPRRSLRLAEKLTPKKERRKSESPSRPDQIPRSPRHREDDRSPEISSYHERHPHLMELLRSPPLRPNVGRPIFYIDVPRQLPAHSGPMLSRGCMHLEPPINVDQMNISPIPSPTRSPGRIFTYSSRREPTHQQPQHQPLRSPRRSSTQRPRETDDEIPRLWAQPESRLPMEIENPDDEDDIPRLWAQPGLEGSTRPQEHDNVPRYWARSQSSSRSPRQEDIQIPGTSSGLGATSRSQSSSRSGIHSQQSGYRPHLEVPHTYCPSNDPSKSPGRRLPQIPPTVNRPMPESLRRSSRYDDVFESGPHTSRSRSSRSRGDVYDHIVPHEFHSSRFDDPQERRYLEDRRRKSCNESDQPPSLDYPRDRTRGKSTPPRSRHLDHKCGQEAQSLSPRRRLPKTPDRQENLSQQRPGENPEASGSSGSGDTPPIVTLEEHKIYIVAPPQDPKDAAKMKRTKDWCDSVSPKKRDSDESDNSVEK